MSRAEIIFPAVLFAVIAGLIGSGWVLDYSWAVIAFPLGAGAVVCALCIVIVAMALAGRLKKTAEEESLEPLTTSAVAWVFAMAPFVYGLGFVFGPVAYLFIYLRANGSSWRLSAGIAAGSLLLTWGLFIKLLQIPLPIEPLWLS